MHDSSSGYTICYILLHSEVFKMIKKKLNILLLLLLALLFISLLGTTSFARTLTQDEIRNFICNSYIFLNDSEPDTDFINSLNQVDFSSWVTATETYEGQWYISMSNSYYIDFGYYYGNANNMNLYVPYIYNNGIGVNTSYLTRKRSRLDIRSFGSVTTFGNNNVGLNTGNYFFYTDTNLYNNSEKANASILYNAGYMTRESIFDYNFTPPVTERFTYARSELDSDLINLNNSYWISETAQTVLFVYNPFSRKRDKRCRCGCSRLCMGCRPF